MKEILESLDIAEEIKAELSESFDKAVLAEAVKLAESKEAEYEEYIKAQIAEMKAELEDTLDAYLEKVVEQFVQDNAFAIEESVNKAKMDALLEGFNSMLLTSGVQLAQIAEAKEKANEEINEGINKELEETKKLADSLMEEVQELKKQNAELLKTGLIKETAEDLTDVQKDKFFKLAKIVEFDEKNPQDYIAKLDTIAESVKTEVKEDKEVVTEKVQKDVKDRVQEIIAESKKEIKSWVNAKHLY